MRDDLLSWPLALGSGRSWLNREQTCIFHANIIEGKKKKEKEAPELPSNKNTSSKSGQRAKYWLESAKDDWKVARHLYENGDYPYALFFGHLTIEKILKAIYAERTGDNPPFTHRLVFLADKASLKLTPGKLNCWRR